MSFSYTYAREDGTLVDGTPCDQIHNVWRKNPMAIGYILNHPSKDKSPNLLNFDAPLDLENEHWNENKIYVPTWHHNPKNVFLYYFYFYLYWFFVFIFVCLFYLKLHT